MLEKVIVKMTTVYAVRAFIVLSELTNKKVKEKQFMESRSMEIYFRILTELMMSATILIGLM